MKMIDIRKNAVLAMSFDFSLSAIRYCEELNDQKHFVIAKQLLRSATSIGANIMEAQQGESRADFIHKMKIAAKEGAETQYWLLLCQLSAGHGDPSDMLTHLESINCMLTRIIATTKANDAGNDPAPFDIE